jgi:hypothetical protein
VHYFKCFNAAMATTAATAKVTTGTAIKTMLQISTPSTRQLKVVSWGFSIDAAPATTGVGVVELIQTDVAATGGTAHVAAGVQPLDPNAPASLVTLGTGNTGYTFTVEGTTVASRLFDAQEIAGVSNGAAPINYTYQFMPDERPIVAVSKFLRVRVTFSAAVNMLTWITWDE